MKAVAAEVDISMATLSQWRALYRSGKLQLSHSMLHSVDKRPTMMPVTIDAPEPIFSRRMSVHINFSSGTIVHVDTDTTNISELSALLMVLQP